MVTTVNPDAFARLMSEHWEANCNNITSPAFLKLWSIMAKTFNEAITSHGTPEGNLWRVLQPSTGTGKTQGARIYSAMVAKANRESLSPAEKVGILIVTREIVEAEKLAEEVNESVRWLFAREGSDPSSAPTVAVAKHSQSGKAVSPEVMQQADVLVITHAAYVKALDRINQADEEKWSQFVVWEGGKRKLTIVDETISNVVETYQIETETLKRTLAYIPDPVQKEYPQQIEVISSVIEVLRRVKELVDDQIEAKRMGNTDPGPDDSDEPDTDEALARMVWDRVKFDDRFGPETVPDIDMSGLRAAIREIDWDEYLIGMKDRQIAITIPDHIDRTLRDVEAIVSRWAWYARAGRNDLFNSSRLLIPDDFPGPVVLDATASVQVLWDLLEDRVVRPAVPPTVRSYANVTLHVAWSSVGVGKRKMEKHGKKRFARLFEDLNKRFEGQDRNILLVTNKVVEHLADDLDKGIGKVSTAHWGAIDGKNDWKDCDTVVIAGLQYKGPVWARNTFLAVKGPKEFEKSAAMLQGMTTMDIVVSVVQAINRARCRKVIDTDGNCPKTDVYIVLRRGEGGQAILEGIEQEMPGIEVRFDWDFSFDGERVEIRRGSSHEGLIKLMAYRKPGEVTMDYIQREFSLTAKAVMHLRQTLSNPDHPLTKELASLGVSYVSRMGRGARPYLVKHAVSREGQ